MPAADQITAGGISVPLSHPGKVLFPPNAITKEDLARLSLALKELSARIRTEGVPAGLPFSHDAASLAAAEVWHLICPDEEFDISFQRWKLWSQTSLT